MKAKASSPAQVRQSLQLASALLGRGDVSGAERTLRPLLQSQPPCAPALDLLSAIANSSGHSPEAVELASAAVELEPARAEFRFTHGRALKSCGQLDEAVAAYEHALRLRPDYPEALVSLGVALRLLGRLDEAIDRYRQALQLRPDFPEALSNLGNALADRIGSGHGTNVTAEDLREAEQLQRRALALNPRDPKAMHNLGVLLKLTGRYEEAATLFNQALALDNGRIDTCLQFGDLLCKEAQFDLARRLYSQWLAQHAQHRPEHAVLMVQLAACLFEIGEAPQALSWLERASELQPGMPDIANLRGRIEAQRFNSDMDVGATLAYFRAAIEARPDYAEAICAYLMMLCYAEEDPAFLLAEHRARLLPLAVAAARTPPRVARPGQRRIRVGYVSSDFKRHSVAYFLEGILEHHDRGRFEIHAYKSNAASDAVTERLRGLCDHWVECSHLSDAQLAERIRDDGIDILIDLSGLTSGNRLGVFQRRPAACQITYLGYPASTGSSAFDHRITDAVIDPSGSDAHSSEVLLRCAHTMFCYRPAEVPPVRELPALARGTVTFGSFNNLSKIGARTLRLWQSVLLAVPGSRLLLKAAGLGQLGNSEFIRSRLAVAGIEPERVVVRAWTPGVNDHLALYDEVDIGLDTFPFNGATTTCEALLMGVPVVTLAGRTQPSRMGASILSAAGLAHLVAHDEAQYVAIAAAMAADVASLSKLRSTMRSRLQQSRLWDRPGFTRNFESLLETALAGEARDEPAAQPAAR